MKTWQLVLLSVFFGLLSSAVLWILISKPRGEPILLPPPPTASPVVVHITGAVKNPGVYTMPGGGRVEDAVDAAGGYLESADTNRINLAARVTDGQKIVIPEQGAGGTPGPTSSTHIQTFEETEAIRPATNPGEPVNINTASTVELDTLPGIGTSKAASIIEYRQKHGPFTNIEEIMDVPGIGPGIFADLKDLIFVDGSIR